MESSEIKRLSAENNRLVEEVRESAARLAKSELELAECRYHLRHFTVMYEDIITSTAWKCIKTVGTLLKIIKTYCFSLSGAKSLIANIAFSLAERVGHSSCRWIGAINSSRQGVAIVPADSLFNAVVDHWSEMLVRFLADQGYLVLLASLPCKSLKSLHTSSGALSPNLIQVPLNQLLNKLDKLQSESDCLHLIFFALPTQDIVWRLPAFRRAGFSIVYDIVDDWQAHYGAGRVPWYDRALEEQAVLYADIVRVTSKKLQVKFSHLRSDLIMMSGDDLSNAECADSALTNRERGYQTGQLLAEIAKKSITRKLYA